MRRSLVLVVLAVVMVMAFAGTASAGEITGTGESTPIRNHVASSICSFSGLNDEFIEGDLNAPRTQSWGSLPKEFRDFLTTVGAHPGNACNPTTAFEE